jgi:flagellar basal-body rod protein FlgC
MMESVQAMQVASISQQVAANNVANMNTNGFRSSRVELETGPGDQGVRVSGLYENSQAGPLVEGGQWVETDEGRVYEETLVEASNTDLAEEMVRMMENERLFEANAVALRAQLEMKGSFIDEMV